MATKSKTSQTTKPAIAVEPVLAPGFLYGKCQHFVGANYAHCSWCELKSRYAHSFVCENCKSFILK